MPSALVEPAYCNVPPACNTLGDEVAELAGLAGFPPDPEQRMALDHLFAMKRDGRVAAMEFAVICSRQNMKTGLFKQAALGWLFVTEEQLVVWSAHEFSTAQEAFRDMATLIESCSLLDRKVKQIHRGNGDEAIELLGGARLKFKARTKGGGRGLSGGKVVLDEAYALKPEHMGALFPLLSAQPDPQVVYGSSAGQLESDVLRSVRDRGRASGDPSLAYLEWCDDLPGDCQEIACDHLTATRGCRLDDQRRWQRANPAMGRRITVEYIENERRALPPAEFARERLGWWDDPAILLSVFPPGSWESLTDDQSAISGHVSYGLEVAQDRSWSCLAAAGNRQDGALHVQVAENHPGTDWIVPKLAEMGLPEVTLSPNSPAGSLIEDLERADVRVLKVPVTEYAQACGRIYDFVVQGTVRHLGQRELDMAVRGATKRTSGDAYVFDRKGGVDISPLAAVTLAAHAASLERVSVYEERGVRFL